MFRTNNWKLLNWSNTFSGPILMATGSVTGSSTGKAMIFAKSDGKIYTKDAEGVESEVGGGGGGSGATRTNYTVTLNDVENVAFSYTYVASFTVPANTWLDGESVTLIYTYDRLQNSGGTNNLDYGLFVGDVSTGNVSYGIANSATIYRVVTYFTARREGNDLWVYRNNNGPGGLSPYVISYPDLTATNQFFQKSRYAISTTQNFATNILVGIYAAWYNASPSSYIRSVSATAFKDSAGNMI